MKKNARKIRRRRNALVTLVLMLLVAVISIGGTIAWLTAQSTEVKNTFTPSQVGVELKETKEDFQMVPGSTIAKDPKVTVTTDSEEVWLFVTVEKSANLEQYIEYTMNDGWTLVDGQTNVYYYTGTITNGTAISVLKDDQVKVSTEVTSAMMTDAKTNAPTLTFQAYVCQKENVADAKTAWSYIGNGGKTPDAG